MKVIRFMSSNKYKISEASRILKSLRLKVIAKSFKIEELQTENAESLVKDKALKAFVTLGRPLFVEHTGLYLRQLNELPGGLTQIFWDRLQADRFCELFGRGDSQAIARTTIAYLDGRTIRVFEGDISGTITNKPRGNREFQWDCVFQPQGHKKTFAELGLKKDAISMRKIALEKLVAHLRSVSID